MTLLIPSPGAASNAFFTATVTLRWQAIHLHLGGELDMATAPDLTLTLEDLDRMPTMTLHIDMANVTFLDTAGVVPLVEAARRRRDHDWPPLLIEAISRPAKRLLTMVGLGNGPQLDVDGWDHSVIIQLPPPS
jgi:anti-anti-sigma factor